MWPFRNKEKEQAILNEPDISYCRRCGNWNMWAGWDKDGNPTSLVCTKCGWVCGDARRIDVLLLKIEEIRYIRQRKNVMRCSRSTNMS